MHYMVYVLFLFCVCVWGLSIKYFYSKFLHQNYTQLHEEILLKKSQIKDLLYMCSNNDTIKESEEESQLVILN